MAGISVDVEGHELEVLRGFSIARWCPAVILVEDNSNYQNADVRDYLRRFGYVRFMRTVVNDWYAHKSDRRLVNLRNTSRYNWAAFKVKARRELKRIPGVVKLRNLLLRGSAKSA